jgi:hypothetical protein
MARPISKTTKFILALSRTMPAKEVLAKAKASGFKTSESNVHRVRRLHGRRSSAASSGHKPSLATAKAASNGAKSVKKSDYVRTFPASLPAKDVVAKAKAAGIKLDLQYVYKIRSRSKPASRRAAAKAPAARRAVTHRPASSVETLLRALGAEIGLGRAVEILEGERARVSSITKHLG